MPIRFVSFPSDLVAEPEIFQSPGKPQAKYRLSCVVWAERYFSVVIAAELHRSYHGVSTAMSRLEVRWIHPWLGRYVVALC